MFLYTYRFCVYRKDDSHTKRAYKFECGSRGARIGETYMGRFLRLKLQVLQEPAAGGCRWRSLRAVGSHHG